MSCRYSKYVFTNSLLRIIINARTRVRIDKFQAKINVCTTKFQAKVHQIKHERGKSGGSLMEVSAWTEYIEEMSIEHMKIEY